MAEVLHATGDTMDVRSLAAPAAIVDPATARLIDATVAEATARAHQDGEAAGRQAAMQEVAQAVAAVRDGLDRVTAELTAQRELALTADLELVSAVAEAVLERTPPDDAMDVLDRIREAVDLLDADAIQVRVNPQDHAVLTEHTDDARLQLVADPAVERGEATIGTPVAGAQLTRRALLDAALRVIAGEAAR